MANFNYNQSDSSDDDDELNAEIEALSKACLPTNNHPIKSEQQQSRIISADFIRSNSQDTNTINDENGVVEDEDEELFRKMEEQYGEPLSLKPIMSLPPRLDDDEDDDLDLLLAIRRNYSEFHAPSTVPPAYDDDDFEMMSAIRSRYSQNVADSAVACDSGPHDTKGSKDDSCMDRSFSKDDLNTPLWSESFIVHRDLVERDPYDAEKEEASTSTPSFPRVAQTFMKAIKKNRSLQKFIRNNMLHIESRMEEIKEVRKRLKTFRDFQVKCKKKIGRALSQKQDARIQLISAPKQKANAKGIDKNASAMCFGPLENSYVASYKAALEKFPLSFHRKKWSDVERQSLEKGLIQQYQEMLLQRSAEALSDPKESGFTHGVDGMISLIRNQEITPEVIHKFSNEVNWKHLASLHLPRRSGGECEARWLNHESRLVNRDKWTPEEDKRLLFLVQHNGIQNWSFIAKKLDTNRTPYQCLSRYQRSLNASIMRRDWTEDEDAQLRSAVESFGESNWQAVASVLEGRTGTQCSNRWKKTLHPARERVGKWSEDEDKRLKVAVTLFGKCWHRIAQFVPGRTQPQCRERWVNVLDPFLNHGVWTEEDDLKLKAAIAEHGYCWSKVAACVPLRTDNQCRRRWKRLFPHEVPLLRAARNLQKAALISNFVDRESDRPALGPNDFVPLLIEGPKNDQKNGNASRKSKKSRKRKETNLTEDLPSSYDLRGARSRKCRRTRSLESKTTRDTITARNSYGDDNILNMPGAGKSGSKKKKCGAKKLKKNFCDSTESDETPDIETWDNFESGETSEADSWDVPISIRSRRARAIRSKGLSADDDCGTFQASGLYDAKCMPCLKSLPDQSTIVESQLTASSDKDTHICNMGVKPSSYKLKKQRRAFSETAPSQDSFVAEELSTSSIVCETDCLVADKSRKRDAEKHHEKSKLDVDLSNEWEDLPLSNLLKIKKTKLVKKHKPLLTYKRRKCRVNFLPPIPILI